MEGTLSPDTVHTLDTYFTIARKKTASLFALAASVGAFCANASPLAVKRMSDFGYQCGTAFQIVDDILDVTADEDLLGKAAGMDLKQKTPSVINISWLQSGDPQAAQFFAQPTVSRQAAAEAAEALKTSPIVEDCRTIARDTAGQAEQALRDAAGISNSEKRVQLQLEALLGYTLQRCL
jgi:geranylgeranyl pyrophosphate synthase